MGLRRGCEVSVTVCEGTKQVSAGAVSSPRCTGKFFAEAAPFGGC